MGVVMIRCPQTGHEIATGIEMDNAEFQRAPVLLPRAMPELRAGARMVRQGCLGV
jgi:hypothetical protein